MNFMPARRTANVSIDPGNGSGGTGGAHRGAQAA